MAGNESETNIKSDIEIQCSCRGRLGRYAEGARGKCIAWVREFSKRLGLEAGCEISLLLCDGPAMRAMNRRWRGLDRPTNVLSFPLQELATGQRPSVGALGDIAISLPVVKREASAAGLTFESHLRRMLAHGLLHLLGHDHGTSDEARAMQRAEQRLLRGGP